MSQFIIVNHLQSLNSDTILVTINNSSGQNLEILKICGILIILWMSPILYIYKAKHLTTEVHGGICFVR